MVKIRLHRCASFSGCLRWCRKSSQIMETASTRREFSAISAHLHPLLSDIYNGKKVIFVDELCTMEFLKLCWIFLAFFHLTVVFLCFAEKRDCCGACDEFYKREQWKNLPELFSRFVSITINAYIICLHFSPRDRERKSDGEVDEDCWDRLYEIVTSTEMCYHDDAGWFLKCMRSGKDVISIVIVFRYRYHIFFLFVCKVALVAVVFTTLKTRHAIGLS